MTNTLQWTLLSFGILIALAGLIAFLMRKEEGSNRVKLFGGEFELSRPALVIILAGCTVAVASLYLPTRQPAEEKRAGTESASTNSGLAHDMRFDVEAIKLTAGLFRCLRALLADCR